VNLRFTALQGRVGTFENALEINSSSPSTGVVRGDALSDIVLVELGTLNVDRIRSASGDVSLTTLDGSIVDFFDDVPADVIGVNHFLTANGGSIGGGDNDLDIDSSTVRPGRLAATASGDIFITETDSSLNVQSALTAGGNIRLTVPDTIDTDEDVILMEGDVILTNEGDITLRAGDDVDTRLGSAMFAAEDIFIFGDFGNADIGMGSRVVLRGVTIADSVRITTLRDPDEVRIENNAINTFIFTSDGDDLIIGSDAGTDDPDLTDTTYFGDYIDAGPGNDRVFGLGGADMIFVRSGDDYVEGGAHGDFIDGDVGDDVLRGGFGSDNIRGGAGNDDIDGGADNDILSGDDGDDQVSGGGGGINIIDGGAGDDVLKGSDESRDGILGGDGRDYIFGYGANDVLFGGAGDDIIDGGAGDDLIQGGAGSDVLIGGPDHDVIAGDDTVAGDDNAVDYLYGDFGTNLNEAGSGRDRLDGQGGNDLLFGEGEDDAITDVLGASNLIDYGAGEGADPTLIVLPALTPNPVVAVSVDDAFAIDTLPEGPTYAGWWAEIAGSATGSGVSGGVGAAIDSTVAVGADGLRYTAWADTRNGNYEIYVARESASGWEMIGGSAAGGGVSDSRTDSRRPALLVFEGRPTVVWTEANGNGTDIQGAQYDAGTDTWIALGASLTPGGISNTARADQAQIVDVGGRILVTWIDTSPQTPQVYGRVFNGAAWVEITPGSASGLGISQARPPVNEYDVSAAGGRIAVTWSAGFGDDVDIFARVRAGAGWIDIGGSTVDGGISDSVAESREPDVAWLDGQLFVAYRERVNDFEQIHVKTFDDGAWVSAGPDGANGSGVSATSRRSLDPKLESGGGEMFLAWVDHDAADYADPDARIYVKRWNGTRFVEALPGDASGAGISATGGKLSALDLAVDRQGLPTVGWTDDTSGLPQAFLRTVTGLPARVFFANAAVSVQSILNTNNLGTGDVIVLAPGVHAGFTLGGNDAGVMILGAQGGGSVIDGTVNALVGGVLQRLTFAEGVRVGATSSGLALVDNTIAGSGLVIDGGSDLQVLHNRVGGVTGIRLAGAAQGFIAHNDVFASGTGLAIAAAFAGDIRDNDFRDAAVGVRYDAVAPLNGNRIHDNLIGIRSTVGLATDALGFLVDSQPNEVTGNQVGIELVDALAQNQRVTVNNRGVIGSGTLGGTDLAQGNVIERNTIGVDRFDGTIRFNRIASNQAGIVAGAGGVIVDNHIYRNTVAGIRVEGVSDVVIERNTLYTPVGDLIRLVAGASDVVVRHNTLWTEDGYNLFVANDSQTGFFSDFNNLYTTGDGKVGFWTRDFTDVLDWQADIARFDLHSVGATVVNPDWARPRFVNLHADDYSLFPMFGTQRFTSPGASPGAGIPHIALRSPDLYVDAVRGRQLAIRWESFANVNGSAVKIDLYRDTADGPAFVATIAASTPDDGEFLWTPSSSGIAFGTYGLRTQVSWEENPLVLDRSQEPFTVPEAGSDYFVDDGTNAGDQYTPNAVGNNRHTGKIAGAPKPYATNLLRVYDLDVGARVFVDTGDYSMIDPIAVSGAVDLGLGRDQGFLMTGPTNAGAVAELFPAIPGDRSRALIELNDADGVTIAHLTLRDAQRGLYAHNRSDDVAAHHIIAFGHALDGIRVETRGAASDFVEIEAHDNGAFGIALTGRIRSLTDSVVQDNATGGIFVRGPIAEITGNVAADNGGSGFEIRDAGAALVQGNMSFRNARGMLVENGAVGATLVGSTDLVPGLANRIFLNDATGVAAIGNVVVAGNTVAGQTGALATGLLLRGAAIGMSNVVFGNHTGIDAQNARVERNRVYANAAFGIRASQSDLVGNVVYSNPVGIRFTGDGSTIRNNLVYASDATGLLVTDASDVDIVNNTLFEPTADALRVTGGSSGVHLRNNILQADNGFAVSVAPDSQSGFTSDNNVFFRSVFGSGAVGQWGGATRTTFAAWRAATGTDTDSVFANPLFVDANGADNVLGFDAGVSDGSDDDFHERSLTGSFHGGSLAPVQGPSFLGIPGVPVLPAPVLVADLQQSPAIDRGDANDPFGNEPAPNGGYVNVGAYGNTEQASLSPLQYVIVMAANGGEEIHQRATFDIRWRHDGFAGPVDILYSSAGGGGPFQVLAANEANDDVYEWTVDETVFAAGSNYIIRVQDAANPAIGDRSDFAFSIVNDPPVVGTLDDVILDEGASFSAMLPAIDPEGGTLTAVVAGIPGATAVFDGDRFLIAWDHTPDGPAVANVSVTISDSGLPTRTVVRNFGVTVRNVAPTLTVSGAPSVAEGQTYTVTLDAVDPGGDTIVGWRIDWGDGTIEDIAGNPDSVSHVYDVAADYLVRAEATDEDGTFIAAPLAVTVESLPPLQVISFSPTASGFDVRFNRALATAGLNLYDSAAANLGLPDVELAGVDGAVRGSLVLDADAAGFSFVKTGAALSEGVYMVRLVSALDAIRDPFGGLLDGDADGAPGADYATSFVANGVATIGIADFARGPEQPANIPGASSGIPLRINGASPFSSARFEVHFDPSLLTITGIVDPAGGTATVDLTTAGVAIVDITFAAPVDGTNRELGRLLASVPTAATYGAKQRLDVRNVSVDDGAVVAADDDAVHVVGFVGDTSFSGTYSLLDVLRLQRVVVGLDSGFGTWPLVDPAIIGDTSGNGHLTASDATLLLREISGNDQLQIPPLPAATPPIALGGPDPLVNLPAGIAVVAGRDVTVPIDLDNAAGLDSVQVRLAFDPAVIELLEVRKGSLTGDFQWIVQRATPGELRVDMARLNALAGGRGSLLDLDLRVRSGVAPGSYRLDLQWTSLNDGRLTLTTVPTPGPDATDGSLHVFPAFLAAPTAPARSEVDSVVATDQPLSPPTPRVDWSAQPAWSGWKNPRLAPAGTGRGGDRFGMGRLGQDLDPGVTTSGTRMDSPLSARFAKAPLLQI
jgi:Ca2+-binding RTX toxin-like protein